MKQEGFVSWKGGKIFFKVRGSGAPIVLLHGFLGASSVFQKVIPALSKKFRVISLDLPGHGRSSSYGYIHTMEWIADVVAAVLNELQVENAFVVGHSMGGYVSLELAQKHKKQVRAICLLNSISFADSVEKRNDRDRAITVIKSNHNIYIRQTIKKLFSIEHLSKNFSAFRLALQLAEGTSVRGLLAALEGMKVRADFSSFVRSRKLPVYWIRGRHDTVFNAEDLKRHEKLFAKSKIIIMENSGHMSMLEEPERCVEIINRLAE